MKKNIDCTKIENLKGFSIPEVIMVLGALAIVSTFSYGDVTRVLDKQLEEANKLDMLEIRKAMELYAKNEGGLPLDTTQCDSNLSSNSPVWSAQLSKYSNLSSDGICFDRYGLRRNYQVKPSDRVFASGVYKYIEYYATVTNTGLNKIDDSGSWSTPTAFDSFSSEGDDIVVKYTDKEHKLDLYNETLKRIETIESYLERYSRSKRSIALSHDEDDFDTLIFYPKDGRTGDSGNYYAVPNGNDYESSLGSLIKATTLVKLLGLPEITGRDAITGKTMFYISNPGVNKLTPCTGERSIAPYYPAVILPTFNGLIPTDC